MRVRTREEEEAAAAEEEAAAAEEEAARARAATADAAEAADGVEDDVDVPAVKKRGNEFVVDLKGTHYSFGGVIQGPDEAVFPNKEQADAARARVIEVEQKKAKDAKNQVMALGITAPAE